jgi:hypothetical protein
MRNHRRISPKAARKYSPEEIRDACANLYKVAAGCMDPKDVELLRSRWERACIECLLEAATRLADTMP